MTTAMRSSCLTILRSFSKCLTASTETAIIYGISYRGTIHRAHLEERENGNMKRTWQPKRIPRLRRHGFLKRMSSRNGQRVIKARRAKGRWSLTV